MAYKFRKRKIREGTPCPSAETRINSELRGFGLKWVG